jgi:outer membrane protein assembly factor BamB
MKKLSLFLLPLSLAACSIFNPYGTTNIPEPAVVPAFAAQLNPHILWQESVGSGSGDAYLRLAPCTANNVIYTIDRKGLLSATTVQGVHLWQSTFAAGGESDLACDAQAIAFVDEKAMLHVVSTDHAKPLWTAQLSDQALAAPTFTSEQIYSKTIDGNITAFDRVTGKEQWQYGHDVPQLSLRASSAVLVDNQVAYIGFSDGVVVALKSMTGEELWTTQAAEPQGFSEVERMVDIDAHLVADPQHIYVATYQGQIAALDRSSGKILWQQANSVYADITLQADTLYAVKADGTFSSYDAKNGKLLWQKNDLAWHFLTGPAWYHNHLVVGDIQGSLYFINPADGKLLAQLVAYKKSPIINTPLIANNALIVIDAKGSLSAVSI